MALNDIVDHQNGRIKTVLTKAIVTIVPILAYLIPFFVAELILELLR